MKNTWEFEGEVVRCKKYESGRFGANIMIRGTYEDSDTGAGAIVEFGCMIPKKLCPRNLDLYKNISCSGHFETWTHVTESGNIKSSRSCIVDVIEMKDGFFKKFLKK